MSQKQVRKWWKEANAYQIWPASFQDSNDDGYGDIPGIISRLDYLKDLGIDLIWLSPVYDSPQHDMGYDISNYEDIWQKYGTLADMEALIREVKARNMKLIMDLVVNHTSNEHKWFKKSATSSDSSNPYHDWYLWQDPKGYDSDGQPIPPNNWRSSFGGSAWVYVESRRQFYLHLFLPEQPDLNWFNPAARRAIYDSAIEFWLKKGIDGFRVDVVNLYWKDTSFPDATVKEPGEPDQPIELHHTVNGPLMHEWLQEQRREALDKYGDVMLVGELPGTSTEEILRYISPQNRELDTIFDFDILTAGDGWWELELHDRKKAKLSQLKPAFVKTQGLLSEGQGWPTTFLENHDNPRSIDKFGPGQNSENREAAATMLALLVTTMSGTLFVYQGQEIGMTNMSKSLKQDDFRDRMITQYFDDVARKYPDNMAMKQRSLDAALWLSRDNGRTPVQWTAEANAGFTKGAPWIGVNDNHKEINVANQLGKADSVLEFWRSLLKLRKQYKDVLVYGDFEVLDEPNDETMSYLKRCPDSGKQIFVQLNFTDYDQPLLAHPKAGSSTRRLLISSYHGTSADEAENPLRPWEGRAFTL